MAEEDKPFVYATKTDAELETLAWDVVSRRVFGSWDIPDPPDVSMVFMVLALMKPEHAAQLRENKIAHCYEYMDKASPRSVNGMPCFFSAQFLNEDDAGKLRVRVEALEEIRKQRQKEAKP